MASYADIIRSHAKRPTSEEKAKSKSQRQKVRSAKAQAKARKESKAKSKSNNRKQLVDDIRSSDAFQTLAMVAGRGRGGRGRGAPKGGGLPKTMKEAFPKRASSYNENPVVEAPRNAKAKATAKARKVLADMGRPSWTDRTNTGKGYGYGGNSRLRRGRTHNVPTPPDVKLLQKEKRFKTGKKK